MHDIRHYAPDMDVLPISDVDFRIRQILWKQERPSLAAHQALDGQLSIQRRDHHTPGCCLGGMIHNEQIPVMNKPPNWWKPWANA